MERTRRNVRSGTRTERIKSEEERQTEEGQEERTSKREREEKYLIFSNAALYVTKTGSESAAKGNDSLRQGFSREEDIIRMQRER